MENFNIKIELDCRGLKCPMPIIKTRKKIQDLVSGEILKLISTDPGSINDINAWARRTGNTIAREDHTHGEFVFIIIKN